MQSESTVKQEHQDPKDIAEITRIQIAVALLLRKDVALAANGQRHPAPNRLYDDLAKRDSHVGTWSLGQAPLFSGTLIMPGETNDWAIMNLGNDPLWNNPGKFPVPRKVLRQLKRSHRSGLDFDTLVVAHEIPAGKYRTGDTVPLELVMPPPPKQGVQMARLLGKLGNLAWFWASLPLKSTVSALSISVTYLARLDPILFGAKVYPGTPVRSGELANWFYLCHWHW